MQVSMFDVADPANPTLAQRIDIGGGNGGWSWSEAEWNEKAVRIIPEAGLILLPVVDWSGGTRSNRASLVDFDVAARTMALPRTIDHDFAPRRAAFMDEDMVASVSSRELLLVDAKNRDLPAVTSDVTLAFEVDRIAMREGVAYMFENGGREWLGSQLSAVLRTAYAIDAENVATEIMMPCQEVSAVEIFNDRLLAVENSSTSDFFLPFAADASQQGTSGSHFSIWSLDEAAHPARIAIVSLRFAAGAEVKLLPVEGGGIAVVLREQGWNCWVRPLPVVVESSSALVAADMRIGLPWIGWGAKPPYSNR